jgi:hypothetical protein
MGLLRLDLNTPAVSFRAGETFLSRSGWEIRWSVSLQGWQSVALSNGLDLARMPGTLIIREGSFDPSDAAKERVPEDAMSFERPGTPVGLLYYLAAMPRVDAVDDARPDAFSVELRLPEEELRALIDKTQARLGPIAASANVPGLSYGYAPDGSDVAWRLEDDHNWKIIDGMTFWFAQAPEEPDPDVDDDGPPEPIAPSAEARALGDLTAYVKSFGTWAVVILAAILLAILWD